MPAVSHALYLALDRPSGRAAEPLVKQLAPSVDGFKVGAELFLAEGPAICDLIVGLGADVFVDLKLHDIPRTVEAGAKRLAKLGARYLTVHAMGGTDMLEAAVQGASVNARTQVLAVTVLTSHTEATLKELGLHPEVGAQVLRLAELAMKAQVPGLVCSALEVPQLRAALGHTPVLVTPGIRLPGGATHDQKRVATPGEAVSAGANVLVLGRTVLDASDRLAALAAVRADIAKARA
jgi:orotidine-5'-phosphate decarboxylase